MKRPLISGVLGVLLLAAIPLTPAADHEWKQLFNGKNLSGWQHVGDGWMSVEDGLIRTHGNGKGGMGLLWWTGGKIGNSVLRVVHKTKDKADNSGVFIRIPIEPREAWMPVHYGYEVNIEYEPGRWSELNGIHRPPCGCCTARQYGCPGKNASWNCRTTTERV
jgi:hypothetical protein